MKSEQGSESRKALDAALRYLTPRARSIQETRRYLDRRGVDADTVGRVIQELERRGLLDDRAFVRDWIQWRQRSRPAGSARIQQELRRKGIDADLLDEVMTEQAGELDSVTAAMAVVRRQRRHYERLEQNTAYRRMLGMLARRGFPQNTARTAVQQVWEEWQRDEGD